MTSYRQHLIRSLDDPLFAEAHEIYRQSFPVYEQRDAEGSARILSHPDFRYVVFLDGQDRLAGLRTAWHTPDFIYLEHFAVSPAIRGGGIGKFLLDELTEREPGKVILEIDPVQDEISTRRLHFYLRNGFIPNENYNYIHPPYKAGDDPYPLLLMSHLQPLSQEQYDAFVRYHHTVAVASV